VITIEVIAMNITFENQAHVLESILKYVAPELGWRYCGFW
jgi:hypothetical protein